MYMSPFALKLLLLFFWALWFTLVLLTNLFEGLKQLEILPEGWKFASRNYKQITTATEIYRSPAWLPGLLFLGVILWQGAATLFFWIAFVGALQSGIIDPDALNLAFASGISLWMAFMIADEVFRVYDGESSHQVIFIAQLVTLLAIHLLPG
jgi:hypothetical protein